MIRFYSAAMESFLVFSRHSSEFQWYLTLRSRDILNLTEQEIDCRVVIVLDFDFTWFGWIDWKLYGF